MMITELWMLSISLICICLIQIKSNKRIDDLEKAYMDLTLTLLHLESQKLTFQKEKQND